MAVIKYKKGLRDQLFEDSIFGRPPLVDERTLKRIKADAQNWVGYVAEPLQNVVRQRATVSMSRHSTNFLDPYVQPPPIKGSTTPVPFTPKVQTRVIMPPDIGQVRAFGATLYDLLWEDISAQDIPRYVAEPDSIPFLRPVIDPYDTLVETGSVWRLLKNEPGLVSAITGASLSPEAALGILYGLANDPDENLLDLLAPQQFGTMKEPAPEEFFVALNSYVWAAKALLGVTFIYQEKTVVTGQSHEELFSILTSVPNSGRLSAEAYSSLRQDLLQWASASPEKPLESVRTIKETVEGTIENWYLPAINSKTKILGLGPYVFGVSEWEGEKVCILGTALPILPVTLETSNSPQQPGVHETLSVDSFYGGASLDWHNTVLPTFSSDDVWGLNVGASGYAVFECPKWLFR